MSEATGLAHLAEGEAGTERLRAELSTRPLRLAFVIRDNIQIRFLTRILEYNSVIWGGYFNCLIPTDGNTIGKGWWDHLLRHSPDVVVFCGEGEPVVSPALCETVKARVQPFYTLEVSRGDRIADLHRDIRGDPIGSVPMWHPLQHLFENLRQPVEKAGSYIRTPAIGYEHPFHLCVAAQLGIARDAYQEMLAGSFRAERVEFASNDLESYLATLGEFQGLLSPLDLTRRDLSSRSFWESEERPEGLSVVLVGSNWVHDVSLFWNLRLAPLSPIPRARRMELLLPADSLRSARNLVALASACTRRGPWATLRITLFSATASRDRLRRLADRLTREMGTAIAVHVSRMMLPIADFRVQHTSEHEELLLEDRRFSFKRPLPEFGAIAKYGSWVVDIDLKDRQNRSYELPTCSRLTHMLCGCPKEEWVKSIGRYWVRYSHGRLACLTDQRTVFVGGHLVSATEAFPAVFQDWGFSPEVSDKHPYAEGFLQLLGSLSDVHLLERLAVRELLWQMQKGSACTFTKMGQILKIGKECSAIVEKLVERRILLRGMSFRCEACGLLHWYPIDSLGEVMQCAGCLKRVRPPVGAPISFRLNELAARAVNQGSIAVLLTERLLYTHRMEHSLALFGLKVAEGGREQEIDLVTTYSGYLLLAECKEFSGGLNPRQVRETARQLSGLIGVAIAVKAPIVLLGILAPAIPPDLAARVLRLNRNGSVAVHLISLTDMKRVNLQNPSETCEIKAGDLFYPMI